MDTLSTILKLHQRKHNYDEKGSLTNCRGSRVEGRLSRARVKMSRVEKNVEGRKKCRG